MPSAEFKLTYFDSYGLGDPVRYALAMSGKPWQDDRISYDHYHTIKHGESFDNNNVAHHVLRLAAHCAACTVSYCLKTVHTSHFVLGQLLPRTH